MERKLCSSHSHSDCWCLKGPSPPYLQQAVLSLVLGRPVDGLFQKGASRCQSYPTGTPGSRKIFLISSKSVSHFLEMVILKLL